MKWSVGELLDFNYIPGINEAMEVTWASGDPQLESDRLSDVSFGLWTGSGTIRAMATAIVK